MNKKNNRKGFTIVELVIVIAVIAILATVLVPTFGNVIADAKNTAVKQEAKNLYTEYVSKHSTNADFEDDIVVEIDGKYYAVIDGVVKVEDNQAVSYETAEAAAAAIGVEAGKTFVVYSDEKTETSQTVPTTAVNPV